MEDEEVSQAALSLFILNNPNTLQTVLEVRNHQHLKFEDVLSNQFAIMSGSKNQVLMREFMGKEHFISLVHKLVEFNK